ncbi:hypothetical protein CDA63_15970 [Hymenobacter amundsenii]|uniref:Uncharacterized protein n=1 Tax=Hymenobacter amundsenii TaxID=2006685 RepID=A0A246FHS4_9BACT|nr:hypothetical protein [Hymenobacter amundsenii]OWP62071.1 hypothetical protein CDA63_15970 [Hymenobacter amundsenii]
MKNLLLLSLLGLLLALPRLGQAQAPAAPTPNFCGLNLPLESGYTAVSGSEITGPAYQLSWMYLDYGVMKAYPPEYIRLAKKKHKGAESAPFTCTLRGGLPVQGTRLSYATETGGMAYQYIVCGVVQGQAVLVDMTLPLDPEKTADLPGVAQQIMHLEK